MKGSVVVLFIMAVIFLSCADDHVAPLPGAGPVDSTDCPPFDPDNQCANTCVGLTPLNDLGSDRYLGVQGGLYPGGSNIRPSSHTAAGILLAGQVLPLDADGNPDSTGGKIVFLSIGMSNTNLEFQTFRGMVEAMPDKNPALVLANGAHGSKDIDEIIADEAAGRGYWEFVADTLELLAVTAQQVQVIWFKEAEAHPEAEPDFPTYPQDLKEKFRVVMNIIAERFPNAKLCYIASRIYGNYGWDTLNREPYAYYTGWAAKFLIEAQINGDPDLAFEGAGRKAPWLSWGAYLWADGLHPRSDGLVWICDEDYRNPDRNHPSDRGRAKVAELVLADLLADETTLSWLIRQ
jgi:hypothetical protein